MNILKKSLILVTAMVLLLPSAIGCTGTNDIKGATGTVIYAGTTIYTGATDPGTSTGVNGDLYINTDNGGLWQKSGGSWAYLSNIKGTNGQNGIDGIDGTDGADGEDGEDGADGSMIYTGATARRHRPALW
jgi:hypothetical protein